MDTPELPPTKKHLTEYAQTFIIVYVIAAVVLTIVNRMLSTNSGDSPALVAALFMTIQRFVSDNEREFTSSEQLRMTFMSMVAVIGVSIVGVVLTVIGSPGFSFDVGVLILVLIGSTFFYALMIWLGYKFLPKFTLAAHLRSKNRAQKP